MAGLQISDSPPTRMGNMGAMVRVMRTLDGSQPVETDGDPVVRKRKLVAGLCRLLGEQFAGPSAVTPAASVAPAQPQSPAGGLEAGLAPRMQQTLRRLLAGDAEKEIAKHLGVSRHTVHVYVKALYRKYDVNSRGELLARFVDSAYKARGDQSSPSK
jgi:DNA-binding NarL/FixJ family response regulator